MGPTFMLSCFVPWIADGLGRVNSRYCTPASYKEDFLALAWLSRQIRRGGRTLDSLWVHPSNSNEFYIPRIIGAFLEPTPAQTQRMHEVKARLQSIAQKQADARRMVDARRIKVDAVAAVASGNKPTDKQIAMVKKMAAGAKAMWGKNKGKELWLCNGEDNTCPQFGVKGERHITSTGKQGVDRKTKSCGKYLRELYSAAVEEEEKELEEGATS